MILFDCFVGSYDKAWRTHRSHHRGPDHERRGSRQKRLVSPLFFLSLFCVQPCVHTCKATKTFVFDSTVWSWVIRDWHYNRSTFILKRIRNVFRNYPCFRLGCKYEHEWQVYREALLVAHMFSVWFCIHCVQPVFQPCHSEAKGKFPHVSAIMFWFFPNRKCHHDDQHKSGVLYTSPGFVSTGLLHSSPLILSH